VNALFVAVILCGTAVSSVALGVFGAYCAVSSLITALDPAKPSPLFSAPLMPRQVSGD
jgi:hypothetical protein